MHCIGNISRKSHSYSTDVSTIYPLNLSVVETDVLLGEIEDKALLSGLWKWDGEKIVSTGQLLQTRRKTVQELSLEAYALQCAVDAGTASDRTGSAARRDCEDGGAEITEEYFQGLSKEVVRTVNTANHFRDGV